MMEVALFSVLTYFILMYNCSHSVSLSAYIFMPFSCEFSMICSCNKTYIGVPMRSILEDYMSGVYNSSM